MKQKGKYILSTAITALIFVSCGEKQKEMLTPNEIYYTENMRVYPIDAIETDTLKAQPVTPEIIGLRNFKVDNGLIVATTSNTPTYAIYSTTGDSICSFGSIGQGPDDFMPNSVGLRPFKDDYGNTCLWVNDINSRAMKLVNLSRIMATGKTEVEATCPVEFGAINSFVTGNTLIYELMDNDAYKLKHRDISNPDDTLTAEQLYIYPTEDFYSFQSHMDVSPDGRLLAMAMSNFDQINLYDMKTGERRAMSVGNVGKYDDVYNSKERSSRRTAYIDIATGNDDIFGLYIGANDEAPDESAMPVIHHFSTDGSLLGIYAVEPMIQTIAFDQTTSRLYGCDENEIVYLIPYKRPAQESYTPSQLH